MHTRRFPYIFAAALFALQGASAAPLVEPVVAPGAHASGGVSYEDQQEMQAKRGLYNLRLTFAEAQTGAYVAGVTVTIEPMGKGAPLGPFADSGPLFYVWVTPGAYRIVATYAGMPRTKTVHVGRGATQATMYWPATGDM